MPRLTSERSRKSASERATHTTGLRRALGVGVAVGIAVGIAVGACGCKPKGSTNNSASASASDSSAPASSATASSSAAASGATGKFTYHLEPARDPKFARDEKVFRGGRFEQIVKAMQIFALPRDVPVLATDAGRCKDNINAFYQPDKHALFLCFAFLDAFYEAFRAQGKNDQEASDLALNGMTFIVFHEMGHALINELGLAVTGKEEDAVDELAATILIENKRPEWAVQGTEAMSLLTAKSDKVAPAYFDEHSLSPQRLGDILCMVYGSDPKKYADFANDAQLKPRLPKCPTFYDHIERAWTAMLEPHYRAN